MTKDRKNDFKKAGLPVPQSLDEDIERREAELGKKADAEFDAGAYGASAVFRGAAQELPGVPLDEKLDPAKVEEYCRREPWILTPLERAPISARFGFIPQRFEYEASRAAIRGQSEDAAAHRAAARQAYGFYYQQVKKDFRRLESQLDRRQIGEFAQQLWVNVFRFVEHEGADVRRFVGGKRHDAMDDGLKEGARRSVFNNVKWLCININEIPLSRTAAVRRPTLH